MTIKTDLLPNPQWADDVAADTVAPHPGKQSLGWDDQEQPTNNHTNFILEAQGDWLDNMHGSLVYPDLLSFIKNAKVGSRGIVEEVVSGSYSSEPFSRIAVDTFPGYVAGDVHFNAESNGSHVFMLFSRDNGGVPELRLKVVNLTTLALSAELVVLANASTITYSTLVLQVAGDVAVVCDSLGIVSRFKFDTELVTLTLTSDFDISSTVGFNSHSVEDIAIGDGKVFITMYSNVTGESWVLQRENVDTFTDQFNSLWAKFPIYLKALIFTKGKLYGQSTDNLMFLNYVDEEIYGVSLTDESNSESLEYTSGLVANKDWIFSSLEEAANPGTFGIGKVPILIQTAAANIDIPVNNNIGNVYRAYALGKHVVVETYTYNGGLFQFTFNYLVLDATTLQLKGILRQGYVFSSLAPIPDIWFSNNQNMFVVRNGSITQYTMSERETFVRVDETNNRYKTTTQFKAVRL